MPPAWKFLRGYMMSAIAQPLRHLARPPAEGECLELTLLELVTAIVQVAENDREVVATVVSLLRSGRVRLRGSFRGAILSTP